MKCGTILTLRLRCRKHGSGSFRIRGRGCGKVGDHCATPLVAMSLALWGTAHRPGTAARPSIDVLADGDELAKAAAAIERELNEALDGFDAA